MKTSRLFLPLFTVLFVSLRVTTGQAFGFVSNPDLPALNIDKNAVTVSGLSAGAFMAAQLSVAYSSLIKGAGIVAGGAYSCARGDVEVAQNVCMKNPDSISVADLKEVTLKNHREGLIDDPQENLKNQKIFVIHGSEDKTVLPNSGLKLTEFYQAFDNQPETEFNLKMGHGFPTIHSSRVRCEASQFPWLNECDYDGAKAILEHLYGPLNGPTKDFLRYGRLLQFDQKKYTDKSAMMLDFAHVYIPDACTQKEARCRLHVALHGCLQAPNLVSQAFVRDAGFNQWAQDNKIVVLYPAVNMGPGNPAGCWDWWGYTGKNYADQSSPQMTAIMKMIQRLSEEN